MGDLLSRSSSALEGRYRIQRRLGEGGMATVYLAQDERHDRKVALKVLRPELAAAVGVERFLAEIRTTASLQHPHILPLFDSGEVDGLVFYVMPYVEGESLAERLGRERQLPVDEAVRIGVAVAKALEHAHERGVIHRDVKPANILLSKKGEPLVADFGIALAASQANQARLTGTGLSLGTPHYMSPEQATGEGTLDRRSDVYALGCVVYEMLVGRPPHEGPSAQAVLTRVLTGQPRRVRAGRRAVPSNVDAAVAKALEPLAADRFSSAGDFARALRDPAFRHAESGEEAGAGASGAADPPPRRGGLLGGIGWIVAALALGWAALSHVGAGGPAGGGEASGDPSGFVARFAHTLAEDESISGMAKPVLTISPDGSSIVYVASSRLYRRDMAELEAVPIRGSEGEPTTPFFSPDGRSVGYWDEAAGELRRIAVAGGTPVPLARATQVYGASWGDDDHILYARPDGVWRVPASGGLPEHLVPIESGELAHGPSMLSDGRTVLFTVAATASMVGQSTAWDSARVVVHSLDTGERRELLRGGDARYVPTGHLVYALDRVLFAVPFDARTKEVRGGPVPVLEGVQRAIRGGQGQGGGAFYAFSRNGTLVYLPAFWGEGEAKRSLLAVDRDGNAEPLIDEERNYWRPRISPDGTRVAVEILQGRHYQIWIVELAHRTARPLTFGGENAYPVWTPDGRSVAYWSIGDAVQGLYLRSADGSGEPELILEGARATDISRDGVLSFVSAPEGGTLGTAPLEGGQASEFLATSAREHMARFSPDGRWLAYTSNESGRDEVYVRPYPRAAGVGRLVSVGGGSGPVWAPDGAALYYRGASGELMAVPTALGPTFTAGRPEPLFRFAGRFRMSGTETAYDIHPDGRRFIMVSEPEGEVAGPQRIHLVQNWFADLRIDG